MIIHGTGMIAKAFKDLNFPNVALFAAGVSYSGCIDEKEYEREKIELESFINKNQGKLVLYFSSFVALSGANMYAIHKQKMENLIKILSSNYLIIRLPQVAGRTSNNTLLASFVRKVVNGETIEIHSNATRRLIFIDDIVRIVSKLILMNVKNDVINIAPEKSISPHEIVRLINKELGTQANISVVDCGEAQDAPVNSLREIVGINDRIFDVGYQEWVVKTTVKLLTKGEISDK